MRVTAAVAAVLLLVVARLIWGSIAARRLNQELNRARPDPLTPMELYGPDGDYESPRNAVPLLLEAMSAADAANTAGVDTPAQSNLEYHDHPPFPPGWHKLMQAALQNSSDLAALKLTRQARQRREVHWQRPPLSPLFKNRIPGLNSARNLANLLGDSALYAHLQGDDAEAVARIEDGLFIADAVDRRPSLIAHLVGVGCEALTLNRLMVIAPGLKISERASDPLRQRIAALVSRLADDSAPRESFRRAFVAERVMQIDSAHWLTASWHLVRPMYDLELARILSADQLILLAAAQDNVPAARAVVASAPHVPSPQMLFTLSPTPVKTAPRFSHQLSDLLLGGLDRLVENDARIRVARHATALSLAAQIYRADHDGVLPPSLDALVPRYIAAIPLDPYGRATPMKYLIFRRILPGGGDRPIVYSIGPDGVDDGGVNLSDRTLANRTTREPQYVWNNNGSKEKGDQVFDLSRWSEPPPATQPDQSAPWP